MELTSRVTALCVVGAVLALVLKKTSPEQALLLVLCAAVAGLALLADGRAKHGEERAAEREGEDRRAGALGVSAAALLVILLI